MFDDGWGEGLDDEQRAAVEHDARPLIVVAGAGTGKTRALTARVARLLATGVPPERVLLLTFTRRAASVMATRAATLCADRSAARRLWSGTFHSIAHRLVLEHAQHLGLSAVSVMDPGDATDLFDLLRADHGLAGGDVRLPSSGTLADAFSRTVNTARPARDVIAEDFPWCVEAGDGIVSLFRAYMAHKRAAGLLDFDDLLLCLRALLADEVVGARLRARWDWVLVDEFQDVNRTQFDIVTSLRPDGTGLTVVGDDAQAVYGFRGATGRHLTDLLARFPDASVLPLQTNYRSTQEVLDLANLLRPEADALRIRLRSAGGAGGSLPRLTRPRDADAEARGVVDTILADHAEGLRLRDQAVLMRSSAHSRVLEIELTARRVPYVKYGGLRFTETAHVKDFLACLRLVHNSRDDLAWYRVLGRHRGIGKAAARRLLPLLIEGTAAPSTVVDEAPAAARAQLADTLAHLGTARASDAPAAVVESCLRALRPLLKSHYPDWAARCDDVDRIAAAAAASPQLSRFAAEMTLDSASASADYAKPPHLDEDYLVLSTVHSAKGLEWSSVHVIHAVDGAFPSDMALASRDGLAEEQRLLYVAVTRARRRLTIHTPLTLPTHAGSLRARQVMAKASRFLTGEAQSLMHPVDEDPDTVTPTAPGSAHVAVPALDDLFA